MPPRQVGPTFTPSPTPRSGSVLPWQILSGVLAIVMIVAIIVTLTNSDNGSQWQTRATTAETLSTQLKAKLTESETSAKSLQARTVKLAAEKADAEDRSKVKDMSKSIAKNLSDQLNSCTDLLDGVFNKLFTARSSAEITAIYNTDALKAFEVCGQAASAAEGFSRYLDNSQ